MAFNKNVIKSFSRIKHDMDIVKESFSKAKNDVSGLKEEIADWIRYFDLKQRELIVEVKELKEKVAKLEEEKLYNY